MVLVELLAAGQRAPWDQFVHVGVAGVVADLLAFQARPGRRGNDLARLRLDVAETDLVVFAAHGEVGMVAAGDLAQRLPGLDGHVAVGLGREGQDHLGRVDRGIQARTALAHARLGHAVVDAGQLVHLVLGVPVDALAAVAQLVQQGAHRGELAVDVVVVAFDHDHVRRGLARHQVAFAQLPVARLERLAQFSRGVVHQRRQHQVAALAQVGAADLAEALGQQLVDLPVGLAFPQRLHRFAQRVDERVHVRSVEVVLLVPGGGGQHDVAVQAGRAHAEVQHRQQVELAFGGVFLERDFRRLDRGRLVAEHGVLRAQQVLQEVFVALAAGTQDIGAPHEHVAREVGRIVRVLASHLQIAGLQLFDGVGDRILAGGVGLGDQVQRIGAQLRRGRQPAHALGAGVQVDHAEVAVLAAVGGGAQHFLHVQLFMAPLAGVGVEERGAVHLPRRARPVGGEGQRGPAELRAQLFLAHVVGPAAAALAHAAAHHQHIDDAPVDHVHVVPVVQAGADDDHGLAFGIVGVLRELARHLDHLRARHAGVLFLPGGRIGHVLVIGAGDIAAAQAAVQAVVGHLQVVHRGHQGLAAVGQAQAAGRHVAHLQFAVLAAEVREAHADHGVGLAQQRQHGLDLAAAAAVLGFQVPAAHLLAAIDRAFAPAEADAAVGRHQVAAPRVQHQRLPVGVVLFAQGAVQVRGAQEMVGRVEAVALFQQHQHGHVGVVAHVLAEIGRRARQVEFLQDHVAHGHGQRGIGALLGRQPDVAELDHFAEVAGHGHGLGALVADFGIEVRVGRAGLGHVGAPHHEVGRVVPVGRFRHVGLFAPDLRAGRRQIAVPVVEAQAGAAQQAQVAGPGGVADHGHGRNRGKADQAVGPELLDRERVGGGDDFGRRIPVGAHEAAQAAHGLVALGARRVLADPFPGGDGVHRLAGLAPHFDQASADHRVLHALRRIHVPAIGGAPRTAPRFVVGQVGPRARIVRLLRFPGDQAVLDVHLPGTRARAVHAMGRTHDLVVLPAGAVGVFPFAVLVDRLAVAVREGGLHPRHELQAVQEMTHSLFSKSAGPAGAYCDRCC
ncbi:hypothetical protein D9M72_313920 [compost metagenome]